MNSWEEGKEGRNDEKKREIPVNNDPACRWRKKSVKKFSFSES